MGVVAAVPVAGAGEPDNDGMTTVRAFYLAAKAGDGRAASRNVVSTRRANGPFSAGRLSAFYGSLDAPLKLQGVERIHPDGSEPATVTPPAEARPAMERPSSLLSASAS